MLPCPLQSWHTHSSRLGFPASSVLQECSPWSILRSTVTGACQGILLIVCWR